jgi:hypothetical protein
MPYLCSFFLSLLFLCRFRNGVRNSAAIASSHWMVMKWYKRGRNRCRPDLRYCLAYFFIIKLTRCTNFTILFWHETLNVSESSSVRHQEFIHCTLSNGICHTGTVQTAFEQDHDGSSILVLLESCLQTCMTYTIAECTVNKLLIMDGRTVRNMWGFIPK